MANIFISYSFNDSQIAKSFRDQLNRNEEHEIFLAEDRESIKIGEEWSRRITESINECSYFIFLMSESSIKSEFVVEEINYAVELKSKSGQSKPYIIPVRINLPFETKLDYNLAARISKFQFRMWKTQDDTETIVNEILSIINDGQFIQSEDSEIEIPILSDGKIPVAKVNPDINIPQVDDDYNVVRIYEQILYNRLENNESLIKIKGPSQYGKGILLKSLLIKGKETGYTIILIDFNAWGGSDFNNVELFLKKFCNQCFYRKNKSRDYEGVDQIWNAFEIGFKDRTTNYFSKKIIVGEEKIILAINDIDAIYKYEDISNEFCSLLRYWYNESGQYDNSFENLKMVMTYSSDTIEAITSNNESPFNVGGDPIVIEPFSLEEVSAISRKYDNEISVSTIQYIFETFGGHPYLTKNALSKLYVDLIPLNGLKDNLIASNSPFHDHLKKVTHLIMSNDLNNSIGKIINKINLTVDEFFKLSAMGIIKGNRNEEEWSNKLYATHFAANF